jgi:hypothetical protein
MTTKNKVKIIQKRFKSALNMFKNQTFIAQCSQAGLIDITMTKTFKVENCAFYLGVNARTIQRYFAGYTPHPSVSILLFNMKTGISQNGVWSGWSMKDNELISPSNESVNPDIISRLWLWRNERDTAQRKIAGLEQTIAKFENLDTVLKLDMESISAARDSLNNFFIVDQERPEIKNRA